MFSCFNCGKENANKKCSKCKSVWFCSKECQVEGWKKHKKDCNEVIWDKKDEEEFYKKINALQDSYKDRFLLALGSYGISVVKLKKVFLIQQEYIYENKMHNKYTEILDETLLYLRDTDTDWRILQTHASKMVECYKESKEEWNTVLYAFYDQMYEETTYYRTLICYSIMHCYYFLTLAFFNVNKELSEYCKKYYNSYLDLVKLYKSKLKTFEYVDTINKSLKKTKDIIDLYKSKSVFSKTVK